MLEDVTTLFRGLGFFRLLFLVLYLSVLWGPLQRSMYNKRKTLSMFQFLLGKPKNVLVVVLCTTKLKSKVFGLLKKPWMKHLVLRPHQIWSLKPKLGVAKLKSLIFSVFSRFSPETVSVPDLIGLKKRFYRIPTGLNSF